MSQEFLRMQKLAGVKPAQEDYNEIIDILTEVYLYNHYYSKGILKENINNLVIEGIIDSIKKKFSNLSSKAKQATKKVVDAVKVAGFNPVEIIGDLSKAKREDIKKALDSIRAIQTLNLAKKLQEAEGDKTAPEFTDINQLKDLKPGDSFIWKGEADPNAKWNGDKITINAALDKFGLKPNTEYIVQPPSVIMLGPEGEEKPYDVPAQIWAKKEVEYNASIKGSKIMKFFRYVGNKLGGKQTFAILTALIQLSGVAGATFGDDGAYGSAALAQKSNPNALDKDANEISKAADDLISNDNTIDKNLPSYITGEEGEIGDSEVIRSLDQNGVDTQGLEVTDNTATTQTYETGEGVLSDTEIEESANELAEKTIDDLNMQLDANEGKNLTKVSLKIKYGAAVSHNQGDDSNTANDGGDLLDQRLESSKKIAKLAAEKVQNIVKKTYGDNIGVDISFTEVDTHDGIDDQKIQKAKDFLETQSSFQSSESDIDTSEKEGKPIKLLYFQFLAEPDKLGPTSPKAKAKEKEQEPVDKKSKSAVPPPVSTDPEMERDVRAIANLNRNSQIALLLSRTSPSLSLFKELKLNSAVNITDGELNAIADQGTYKGEPVSGNAKKLAGVIRASRKNPNSIIKAYSKLTGTNAKESRARAISVQPGRAGQAPIREEFSNLTKLLSEAAIDSLLSLVQAPTTQQSAFLTKLLNIMYVGTEGGDVLDPETNKDPNFKVEYDKIQSPIASKAQGKNYIYLDKKQDQVKPQSDADRLGSEVEKNKIVTTDLTRINTQDEVRELIVQLVSLLSPNLVQDKNNLKNIMFGVRNRLKEGAPTDVSKVVQDIMRNPTIVNRFKNINSVEEAVQAILREILPFLNPVMFTKKGDQVTASTALKNAVIGAANVISSPKFTPSKPETK